MNEFVIQPLARLLRQPAFVICILILAVCAGGIHVGADKMKMHFRKEPVPLQKSLDDLDVVKLQHYKLLQAAKISSEIESELGTKDYIQWVLEDTQAKANDPFRLVSLFITYYTGNPDKVPHVPDVCYVGGGGLVRNAENSRITITENGTKDDQIPIRLLDIETKDHLGLSNQTRTVGYFFAVNGTYRATRQGVQLLQNNVYDRYAYFSKVELYFPAVQKESRSVIISEMEKFLQLLVPVLVEDHLPRWSEWKDKEEQFSETNL